MPDANVITTTKEPRPRRLETPWSSVRGAARAPMTRASARHVEHGSRRRPIQSVPNARRSRPCSPISSNRRRWHPGSIPKRCGPLMSHYYDAMRGEVERHGGRVDKFIGDAVVAFFGVPVAHEDDALRARSGGGRHASDDRGPQRSDRAALRRTPADPHRHQHRRRTCRRGVGSRELHRRRRGERRGPTRAERGTRRGVAR